MSATSRGTKRGTAEALSVEVTAVTAVTFGGTVAVVEASLL